MPDIGQVDQRRVVSLQRDIEPGREQIVVNGVEALWAFGMAAAHVVAAAIGMAVEGGRHRAFDGLLFG